MFHRFLVFFKASRKFAFGFPDITLVTIFAWDQVDGATSLIFWYWIFRIRKQIPDGLVWFLSIFDVVIRRNKKVLGKMKDECGGGVINEVVAVRPKMYSVDLEGKKNIRKVKGVKKKCD